MVQGAPGSDRAPPRGDHTGALTGLPLGLASSWAHGCGRSVARVAYYVKQRAALCQAMLVRGGNGRCAASRRKSVQCLTKFWPIVKNSSSTVASTVRHKR